MARKLLFVDIETIPDYSRAHLWESKERELSAEGKGFIPALIAEFCTIVAMGWAIGHSPPDSLVVGTQRESKVEGQTVTITEQRILECFWRLVSADRPIIVGFNILAFDLPVILVRSALLRIKPTRLIDRRPWGQDCIDLYEARRHTNGGGGLKDLARYFGFDVPEPDIDGSQVEKIFRADPHKIARYVESDVLVTRQLYDFYKGFFVQDYGDGS